MSGTLTGALTGLSLFGAPRGAPPIIGAKPAGGLPISGIAIPDFDVWRAGYGGAAVQVTLAGSQDLAPLFYDPALTRPAPNPLTLATQTDGNGTTYGKWFQPVYTYLPYYLIVNSTDSTGVVVPPLTSLNGEDASYATVMATRGGYPVTARDWCDRDIFAMSFGAFGPALGSNTNTTTLQAAIGAAAGQGGGVVHLAAGTIQVNPFSLPQGVILQGFGLSATTLQCASANSVCTLAGSGAGLRDLVLDGLNLNPASIGVDMTGLNAVVFDNVLVQRFAMGMRAKGVSNANWKNLSIVNCATAADFRGDSDASNTAAGTAVQNITWTGGTVGLNTSVGVIWEAVDRACGNITLENIVYSGNVGVGCDAVRIGGARNVRHANCSWVGNTDNWTVSDPTATQYVAINTCRNIFFDGGSVSAGNCVFNGTCADVQVRGMDISGASINLTIPLVPISFVDCYLDAATTITGDTTKFASLTTADTGIVTGITTDGNPITAWQIQMQPGQVALVDVKATAKQENGVNYGVFWEAAGANCPGATINFSSGTAAFTVAAILTGQTSGASGRIVAVSGTVPTGTLTVQSITGTFQSGELLTDSSGGSARMSGPITINSATLDAGGSTHVRTPQVTGTSGYTVVVSVSGVMLRVQLTGAASHTVAWEAKVSRVIQ